MAGTFPDSPYSAGIVRTFHKYSLLIQHVLCQRFSPGRGESNGVPGENSAISEHRMSMFLDVELWLGSKISRAAPIFFIFLTLNDRVPCIYSPRVSRVGLPTFCSVALPLAKAREGCTSYGAASKTGAYESQKVRNDIVASPSFRPPRRSTIVLFSVILIRNMKLATSFHVTRGLASGIGNAILHRFFI